MDFNFDEIYKIPLRAMKINSSHPSIKRDGKWLLYFISCYTIYTLIFLLTVYNIVFINLKSKEFDQTCKNGVVSVVYFEISYQYIIMFWNQKNIIILISMVKRDYELAKSLNACEQEIMHKYMKKGSYVCKQWLVMCSIGSICFPVKNIALMIYSWTTGEPKLIPMYDLVYPAIIEEKKYNIYVYLVLYASMFFYCCYSSCMYIAFVPVGPIFMLHACAQLEIVEKKIDNLFEGSLQEIEERFKKIIKQLQYIYGFVDQILVVYKLNYELTLKASSILLPVTCYEVIEAFNKGDVSLEFLTFIVGGVSYCITPCYYGNLLMEKGENVRLAIYSSGWESIHNRRIRGTIAIMLTRALKPVAIRTLFRTVCLDALTDLFQQSYAIFNLMNAMWK